MIKKILSFPVMKKTVPLSLAILIAFNTTFGLAIIQYYYYRGQIAELLTYKAELANTPEKRAERLKIKVIPEDGLNLGIRWEDLGEKLLATGVIDEEEFFSIYKFSGEREEFKGLLTGNPEEFIILNEQNSRFILNTFWALGLVQKSNVLDTMLTEYDQVENLAATGGWTLGKGDAMEFYNTAEILNLSEEQQHLVKYISENIYRPCCNNHTAFADCNHGMAMLGLVELMVANGYEESEIYDMAVKINSFWFTDTYMTLADYFETQENTSWEEVDSRMALAMQYSSGSGFRDIQSKVKPISGSGGGGCGV